MSFLEECCTIEVVTWNPSSQSQRWTWQSGQRAVAAGAVQGLHRQDGRPLAGWDLLLLLFEQHHLLFSGACLLCGLSIVLSFGFNTILLCLAWFVWYSESKNATSISSLSDLMLPLGYNGDTRLGQKKVGSRCWQQSFLTWYKFSTLVSKFYEIFVY